MHFVQSLVRDEVGALGAGDWSHAISISMQQKKAPSLWGMKERIKFFMVPAVVVQPTRTEFCGYWARPAMLGAGI